MEIGSDKFCPDCEYLLRKEGSGFKCDNCGCLIEAMNLSRRCSDLLSEIETLPCSEKASTLSVLASELLREINLGEEPRGEWTSEQRRLLNI